MISKDNLLELNITWGDILILSIFVSIQSKVKMGLLGPSFAEIEDEMRSQDEKRIHEEKKRGGWGKREPN
jgi:hypothetical protein